MEGPASTAGALPLAYAFIRVLIVLNWAMAAAIVALLAFFPTTQWIMSSLDLFPGPEADRVIMGLHAIAVLGVLVITHYSRLLRYIKPNVVHVLVDGRIVRTGGAEVADELERDGYAPYGVEEEAIVGG